MATGRWCAAVLLFIAAAVQAQQGYPALPSVPTFDELGVPGVYSSSWYGILAPAGVPNEVVLRINAEVNALLRTPEVRKRLADFGGEMGGGSPEEFAQFMASETRRYAEIVKASGVKVE